MKQAQQGLTYIFQKRFGKNNIDTQLTTEYVISVKQIN